uniref:4'-phosphopantetheinyl transferase n=1 Tax=Solibacter usitatus (strain Ellin6076) TaxID=234267 RepID=Q01XE3_SOLUE
MSSLTLKPFEIHVWRICLDHGDVPAPTPGESARALRLASPICQSRYLRAHGARRAILGRYTNARLDFALHEKGKPYLCHAPELQFNLSHSSDRALVAITLDNPVGVDLERIRPLAEHAAIAERYFPPSERQPGDQEDFFRRWTRYEAVLKAQGVGLYGAGAEVEGEWSVHDLDAGPGFAAAVAAPGEGYSVAVYDYGED